MTSISHEQARGLLQAAEDQTLGPDQRENLDSHLSACGECRAYAEELNETGQALRETLQVRWNVTPLPISMEAILRSANTKGTDQPSLKIISRFAAVPAMLIAFLAIAITFSVWRYSSGTNPPTQTLSASALQVPTPSAQWTATRSIPTDCDILLYEVQEKDTLASIADQFLVSREMLIEYNHLSTEVLSVHTQIKIPVCNSTPLVSSKTPQSTLAYTPHAEFTLSTP